MTPAGALTRFSMPANVPRKIVERPQAITLGPDGAMWFTVKVMNLASVAPSGARIGRITTSGALTEITLPTGTTRRTTPNVGAITTGADGALWFTDAQLGTIDRITTAGTLTTFAVPFGAPSGITSGADGSLWFTANGATAVIGRLTTAGAFTSFPIAGGPDGVGIGSAIAVARDGSVWSSIYDMTTSAGSVVRLSAAGALTRVPFPTFTEIDGVAAASDGSVWLSVTNNQSGASSIQRLTM
jgi:virginiamycin B lyase